MQRRQTLLSPGSHGSLEILAGIAIIVAPTALGAGLFADVLGVLLGSLLIGMAVGLTGTYARAVAGHRAFDRVFPVGAALCALAVAVTGDLIATLLFAAVVLLHLGLSARTRYVGAL